MSEQSPLSRLAERCDERFSDATVLIDDVGSRETLLLEVEGYDKDAVARRSGEIERAVQDEAVFQQHNGRSTVERKTVDSESEKEFYDVLIVLPGAQN